ncbi:MAG TPA: fibronectin type III domain-containing protein [Candidatus Nanopelagicales bacterium]
MAAALLVSASPTLATAAPAGHAVLAGPAVAAPAPAKSGAGVASLAVAASSVGDGGLSIVATTNAKVVQVRYRTAGGAKGSERAKVRAGEARLTLPAGVTKVRVRAQGSKRLASSPWAVVVPQAPDPVAVPSPGRTYRISTGSRPLGKFATRKTLNRFTHDSYLLRSYMQRFEAAGGGTLVLAPGRYELSSTIYVPSNTTIRLSAGTTLVKLSKTGTRKFDASNSMFMLIRPSKGRHRGAVGKHDGERRITIAGAGDGRSVIDLADIRNSLGIIAGHNRDVTISGITFRNMNNNHFIEMDGCADCTISGNEFLDATRSTRETAEAINLDTPDPKTRGFGSVWSKQDRTPNERVTITGNRFDGLQRAVGTHNFSAGRYHRDIVVTENLVTDNADDAFQIMNWANPVFTGNAIETSSDSVGIRACGTLDPMIQGNAFSGSRAAVVFRGCRGENGRTRSNAVSSESAATLPENVAGEGLDRSSVQVPAHGAVALDGGEQPAGAPVAPAVGVVTPGDRQVTVTWTPGVSDPDNPVTGFRVTVQGEGEPHVLEAPAEATQATITGLTNGVVHVVMVAAVNRSGASPIGPWNATPATPKGPPGVVREVVATSDLPGRVQLTWAEPGNDGGEPITGYRVMAFTDAEATIPLPGSPWALDAAARVHVIADLPEGSWAYLRVAADNALGEGEASPLMAVQVQRLPARVLDPWFAGDSASGVAGAPAGVAGAPTSGVAGPPAGG